MGSEHSKKYDKVVKVETNDDDDKVITRLACCFKNNVETLSILFALLQDEEAEYGRDKSTMWILYRTLTANATDELIKKVTESQIDNVLKTNGRILNYLFTMADTLYIPKPNQTDEEWYEKCRMVVETSSKKAINFYKFVPKDTQNSLFSYLNEMKQNISSGDFMNALREHPKICAAIVAAALLSLPAAYSIYNWYTCKISGKRCIKQISQLSSTLAGAVGGGYAGVVVAAAAFTNPVTGIVLVGGVIGCILATLISSYVSDKVLSYIFDLPPTEALEKAYNFIGVSCYASDKDVDAAVLKKLDETLPRSNGVNNENNGEKDEAFQKVHMYSLVIKISRGWKPARGVIEMPE